MFRKISITFISKSLHALLGFINAILLTQYTGSEGKGISAIFLSNMTLCMLFCHILGGNSVIYLSSRINTSKLLLSCYVWEITIAFLVAFILNITGLCPTEWWIEIGIISACYSLFHTQLLLLLGKQHVILYNILYPMPMLFQLLLSMFLFYFYETRDITTYLYSLYGVFGLSYVISLLCILPYLKTVELPGWITLQTLWHYGSTSQSSTIIHFFNNRISFYVLNYFFAVNNVGIYSVAVALIEVTFMIGNSVSLMMHSRIAAMTSPSEAIKSTIPYFFITFLISCITLSVLIIAPVDWYTGLFGQGFESAKTAVLYLSPGALMMNLYFVSSSYFSGTGKYLYNLWATGLGFVIMLAGSILFIPTGGIISAAIVTSIAFSSTAVYSLYVFRKKYSEMNLHA